MEIRLTIGGDGAGPPGLAELAGDLLELQLLRPQKGNSASIAQRFSHR